MCEFLAGPVKSWKSQKLSAVIKEWSQNELPVTCVEEIIAKCEKDVLKNDKLVHLESGKSITGVLESSEK